MKTVRLALLLLSGLHCPAHCADFTVTTTSDLGPGSLREAIHNANSSPGLDKITFTAFGQVLLASPLPQITDPVTIVGPGTNLLTISGNNSVQVLSFNTRATSTISALTIANGLATGYVNGAGLANFGSLTVSNCILVYNTNLGGWGGALYNQQSALIFDTVFAGNEVVGGRGENGLCNGNNCCAGAISPNAGGGGGAGMGGAIFSTGGRAVIHHCTFVGNKAIGGAGGDAVNYNLYGCGRGGGVNGGAGSIISFGYAQHGGFGGGGGGGSGRGGDGGYGGGSGGSVSATAGQPGFGGGSGGWNGPGSGGGGAGLGGAIFLDTGTVSIVHCSFTNNEVAGGPPGMPGGGIWATAGLGVGPDFLSRSGTFLPRLQATTDGGGVVISDPSSAPYLADSIVTLTAIPNDGWRFLHWLGDAQGTNATLQLTMTHNKTAKAVFGTTLTVAQLATVAPVSDLYPYGTSVKITALPPTGTYFTSWSLGEDITTNPLCMTITNPNQVVSCNLSTLLPPRFALTVMETGAGHINLSPAGNSFTNGASVILTAVPDSSQDFLGWGGNAAGLQNPLTIQMTNSQLVTAAFTSRPMLTCEADPEALAESGVRVTVAGEFGRVYQLWRSADLATWSEAGKVTNIYGISQITDFTASNSPHLFYRAMSE